ncbi:MAG: aldo/keto reductase [Bryobacteraceae bacterium]|nr:aldo/keto reductase [Bryobacteraceae bacterium]
MPDNSSRRNFLAAAGLALPASALAATTALPAPIPAAAPAVGAKKPSLQFRTLGKTGLKVTTMGFGCMVTSDPVVIQQAVEMGVNYFDTARVYQGGNNERMVGAALKGKRQNLILSSKTLAPTKEGALAHLETSLKELQTDYLDIWYLHSKSKAEHITDELLEAQRIAKQQGKIRFAGISTHVGHRDLIPAVIKCGKFDVLLASYNFTMGNTIDDLLGQAHAAGIGIVAMKVFAGGYKPIPAVKNDPAVIERLHREGAMFAALKWAMKSKFVDTTIPSITDLDQLDEDLRSMATPFTAADDKVLSAQLEFLRPRYCRMCNSCDGVCSQGLPVADVLRFLMYAEGYGQFPMARENFLAMPEELRNVRCGDCTDCTVKCANGVHVRERLQRAQEIFA